MYNAMTPKWLDKLERKMGWFSLPNLALYLIVLQVFGYVVVNLNPAARVKLILDPSLVLAGEIWRLFTFLGMPMVDSSGITGILFMAIALFFLYFVVQTLEDTLGEFKTTFYLGMSVGLTILFSFATGIPIASAGFIEASLFLAAATLYPNTEILLMFVIPVKLKWLGWAVGAYMTYIFIVSPWQMQVYLAMVFSNYVVFFGYANYMELKSLLRRLRS